MVMQKCPIPSDLVGEYSAACQIVSQYEELRYQRLAGRN
jgi:hypothetical protein